MKRWIWLACVMTLAVAATLVIGNERLLAYGEPLRLRLAPVDPRSLMQGDYMALHFAIGQPIVKAMDDEKDRASRIAVVTTGADGVADFVRLHRGEALAPNERLLRFQLRPSRWGPARVQISTDAYFFEEGQGGRYAHARFGLFRVDAQGKALLVGLADDTGRPL